MKRKHIGLPALALLLILTAFLAAGCGGQKKEAVTQEQPQPQQTVQPQQPDAVTTASIVNDETAFLNAAGANGTWIIAVLRDMTINQDVVLEGNFNNSSGVPERKIALYAQDANRTVTQRYTLTAPRLIVRSNDARIQGGTFVGDVYVEANNFLVIDATVQGNVYFANDGNKSTFKIGEGGKVTGETAVKQLGG